MDDTETGCFARSAVLFDFDGTIADTGPAVMRAAAYTLTSHGYSLDEVGNLQLLIGPPIVDGFMEVAHLSHDEAAGLVGGVPRGVRAHDAPGGLPGFSRHG